MQSPTASSLSEANSDARIGPNQRSGYSSTAVGIESIVRARAPLPTTFDVQPIQQSYFSEFTYFDVFGGILVTPMAPEPGARVMQIAASNASPDHILLDEILQGVEDKYKLGEKLSYPDAKKIVFLPGGNLAYSLDRSFLDRVMFDDPEVMVKPHPVTADDFVRSLGNTYGYHRIINPSKSGMAYLSRCERVWTGANSEIGLVCAMRGVWFDVFTNVSSMPRMTYASIYRLFRRGDAKHNKDVMARVLAARDSGLILPQHKDKEARAAEFFRSAMEVREVFRPSYPGLMFSQPK